MKYFALLLSACLLSIGYAVAQLAGPPFFAPPPEDATGWLTGVLLDLAFRHPWILTLLSVIGLLRLVCKPIMAWLHGHVARTESPADDALLARVEASPWFRILSWLVDYLGSIKLDTLRKVPARSGSSGGTLPLALLLIGVPLTLGAGCATKAPEIITTRITYSTNGLDVVSPKDITFDSLELEDPTHGVRAKVKGYSSTASAAALRSAEAEQAGWMAQMQMMQQMLAQWGEMAARAYGVPVTSPAPSAGPTTVTNQVK